MKYTKQAFTLASIFIYLCALSGCSTSQEDPNSYTTPLLVAAGVALVGGLLAATLIKGTTDGISHDVANNAGSGN